MPRTRLNVADTACIGDDYSREEKWAGVCCRNGSKGLSPKYSCPLCPRPAELQHAVDPACIRVLSVKLNDLTYAPEISQTMLMRQQALALIDARKTIVEGAVAIVHDAVERLRAAGLEVSPAQTEVLTSNLLVVLCSGEHAQPVPQVQASQKS